MANQDSDEPFLNQKVFWELVRVFSEVGEAKLVLRLAGFPPERIPPFDTSLMFWQRVARQANNGALVGGLRSIIKHASVLYPANRVFAKHRAGVPRVVLDRSGANTTVRRLYAEAESHRVRARLKMAQAQEELAAAQAFRELAETLAGLREPK